MQAQSTTKNAACASPVSCDIHIPEEWVSAVEQVDTATELIWCAMTIMEALISDGQAGNQVLFLMETANKNLRPVRAALASGELCRIGGAA